MFTNFGEVKVGEYFTTKDGEKYRKVSNITFTNSMGIEQYIDPLFDNKIGPPTLITETLPTGEQVVKHNPESDEEEKEPEYIVHPQSRVMTKNPNAKKKKAKKEATSAPAEPTAPTAAVIPVEKAE
jgi:hypothetical protein